MPEVWQGEEWMSNPLFSGEVGLFVGWPVLLRRKNLFGWEAVVVVDGGDVTLSVFAWSKRGAIDQLKAIATEWFKDDPRETELP